jgi:hypothetical protein
MTGFHVGQSQKTHHNGIFRVTFERLLEKANRFGIKTQGKAGSAGKKIARRRPRFKGDVVVQGGQRAGIILDRVQRPAEEEKGLGGAFVFGDNFFKYRNGGFIIPPFSGFYRLFKLLFPLAGVSLEGGLPVKTACFCRNVSCCGTLLGQVI